MALAGLAACGEAGRRALPTVSVALFGASLPVLVGTDWMPSWRFSVPYLPLLAVIVALGWMRVVRLVARRVEVAILAIAVAVPAFQHHDERLDLAELVKSRANGYASGHRRLASWIGDEAARPGDIVALMDIGIVGYECPEQRILDLTGLTDRHIARSPGTFLAKDYDPAYVLDREPEIIIVVLSVFVDIPVEDGGETRVVRRAVDPSRPIPDGAYIGTWTEVESAIMAHPEFKARYQRTRPDPGRDAPLAARVASRLGVAHVFEHEHPDQIYLLAAFRRHAPKMD